MKIIKPNCPCLSLQLRFERWDLDSSACDQSKVDAGRIHVSYGSYFISDSGEWRIPHPPHLTWPSICFIIPAFKDPHPGHSAHHICWEPWVFITMVVSFLLDGMISTRRLKIRNIKLRPQQALPISHRDSISLHSWLANMATKSVWQRLYDSFNEEYVPSSFSIQGI